jgi:hypothetical protein
LRSQDFGLLAASPPWMGVLAGGKSMTSFNSLSLCFRLATSMVVPLLFLLTYDSRSLLINSATKSSTFPRPPMFLYDDHPLSVVLLRLYVCRIYGLCVSPSFVTCCTKGIARQGIESDQVNFDKYPDEPLCIIYPSVDKGLSTGIRPRYDMRQVHATSRKHSSDCFDKTKGTAP